MSAADPQGEEKQSLNKAMQLLSRSELATLTKRNDVLATALLLLRLIFHVVLSAAGLMAMDAGNIFLGLFILAAHMAAMSFLGWAGIGHELFHRSVFSSKRVNELLFKLFSILTWSNYAYFQISHPIHHSQTLSDRDMEVARSERIGGWDLFLLFTFDFLSFYRRLVLLVKNSRGIVPKSGDQLFPVGSVERKCLCAGARVVLGTQLAMMLLFALFEWYGLILVVNLAPFCLTFFNRTLAFAQHYGLSQGPGRDYFPSTRTVLLHPVCAFFYANMNFHVEHHFFPGIPFYNLNRTHRLITAKTSIPHLSKSYFDALKVLASHGLFDIAPFLFHRKR